MINNTINSCEHYTLLKGQGPGLIVISLCGSFLPWWFTMNSNMSFCPELRTFLIPSLDNTEDEHSQWEHSQSNGPGQRMLSSGHNSPQGVACQPAQSLRTWEKPGGVACPTRPWRPPCPRVAVQLWPGKKQEAE